MRGISKQAASVVIGVAVLLGPAAAASAQTGPASPPAIATATPADTGIGGTVHNERGEPIAGVVVSIVGSTTTFAVTDNAGQFEVPNLAPGPYLVRAHCRGYLSPKSQTVAVKPRARTAWIIAMRSADAAPTVLAAGLSPLVDDSAQTPEPEERTEPAADTKDDHSETAWRLRHARRGILRDTELPTEVLLEDDPEEVGSVAVLLGRAVSSPARAASNFFTDTPFSGQVNLLTTNSFDTPEQLLSGGAPARGIAYVKVGAPVGSQADWTVRAAITEADIASWIVAGAYKTRGEARHAYDIGMSYSTQRYSGGNPLSLREVTETSRNAGILYGFETFTIAPALAVTYGASYARYDYLDRRGLFSPRAEVVVKPFKSTRVSLAISSRADAPGAAEFAPPSEEGIWLPPQRTFSSVRPGQPMHAERTGQIDAELERDFGVATVGVRAFHQDIDDQLVTIFGADVPTFPASSLGHYVVGNVGDGEANGGTVSLRSALGSRVRGSVAYTSATARMTPAHGLRYIYLLSPSTIRRGSERLQDVTSSIEADVPETSTKVFLLYRIGNGFARSIGSEGNQSRIDSRFDVQVRQSLPFMNFTSARWEMLVAIRNFFKEVEPDQSVYDELLTVRPPKRIVGGVTLHF